MSEKMNAHLSAKLKILSLVAIVMVLYIHTYYSEGENLATLGIIETLIGQRLCLIAVPMFYVISGYLFFLKMSEGVKSIGGKLKKRVRTLLVPYLLANLFTFLFYVTLNCITMIVPAIDAVVNFKIFGVIEQGLLPTLKLIFIDPPIAFQMWFVRDLMVVMALSPIIYFAIDGTCKTRLHWVAIVLLLLAYIMSRNHWVTALVWFCLGGLFAIHPRITVTRKLPIGHGIVISMTTLVIIAVTSIFEMPSWTVHMIAVFGVPTIWWLMDSFDFPNIKIWLQKNVCPYTFFIYLTHEPLLNIFKKLPLLVSRSECMFIICYILVPLVYVTLACIVGGWLAKKLPRIYKIYTGGR